MTTATALKWTRSTNLHGWLAIWVTPEESFEITRHIGETAHYDYGVGTGRPYLLQRSEPCAPNADGDTICWYQVGRFRSLRAAKAAAEGLR